MHCPKCKKETNLQTKRTVAEGPKVRREKFCPKCHSRFYTIEIFLDDHEAMIARHAGQLREQIDKAQGLESNYNELKRHIAAVLDHVKASGGRR